MKTLIRYTSFFVLLAIFLSGCKKDLGNYNYSMVDSVFIKNMEETYTLKAGISPSIQPEIIHFSGKAFHPDDYTFKWSAFKQGANQTPYILGEEQNLDKMPPIPLGEYHVYYTVMEKSTNISWSKGFTLKITPGYNGGWMILSEDGGNSRLDFFEYDHSTASYPLVHRNFQKEIKDSKGNLIPFTGKPKFIETWNNAVDATGPAMKYFVYIGTENSTEKINLTDGFIWNDQYSFKFETANPSLFQTVDAIRPTDSRDGYVVKGNDVYFKLAIYQLAVGTPINRLEDGYYFKVSPYVATYSSYSPACLMYDETNKRFVRNGNYAAVSSSPLPYNSDNSAFNPNDVGMDLVWMNQTLALGGQAYAVLKKGTKYFLARMDNNSNFSARYLDDITSAPEISNASRFEVDNRYGYLQYVVGGKIYQYDPNDKTTKLMKDYGNRQISVFKYLRSTYVSLGTVTNPKNTETYGKRFLPLATGLIVATFDPNSPATSGKVDVLNVPQFNAPFSTFYSFDGFGKVADATEAEVPFGW